jgi:hypothetical protein
MNSLETLTSFFGWCTVLNFGFMALSGILVMGMRDSMTRIHARMYGVSEADLPRVYFQYLAMHQLAILTFNLTPYLALKILA